MYSGTRSSTVQGKLGKEQEEIVKMENQEEMVKLEELGQWRQWRYKYWYMW